MIVLPSSPGGEANLADIEILIDVFVIAVDVEVPDPPAEFELGSIALFCPLSLGSGTLKAELKGLCSYGTIDVDDAVEIVLCILAGVKDGQAGVLQDLPLDSENRETALGFYHSGLLAWVLGVSSDSAYGSDLKPPEFAGKL